MSAVTHGRYMQTQRERESAFLAEWLGQLPRGGLVGTIPEIWWALEEFRTRPGSTWIHSIGVPLASGLSRMLMYHKPTINAVGWQLDFTRTARARFIVFARARK